MKFAIIGLGNFGQTLAVELTALGHEVIGADNKAVNVESIKNNIAAAYTLDATDPLSLAALPLSTMDVVIVAIGENFGASVKSVAILKQLKIKKIYARAIDDIHGAILEGFQIAKILTPERDSARQFVNMLDINDNVDSFPVDSDSQIVKFEAPAKFVGSGVNSLRLREEFEITIIAITGRKITKNFLGISVTEHKVESIVDKGYIIKEGDELVCYGKNKSFHKLWKAL